MAGAPRQVIDSLVADPPSDPPVLDEVVDAPEVSLNVSREILQITPAINAIKKQIVKRALRRIGEVSREEPEQYKSFWEAFGATLKEGVAMAQDAQDSKLPLEKLKELADFSRVFAG